MFIINKKRLSLILAILMLSMASFKIGTNVELGNTVTTVSLPVTNKTVVLDARAWLSR